MHQSKKKHFQIRILSSATTYKVLNLLQQCMIKMLTIYTYIRVQDVNKIISVEIFCKRKTLKTR